jgi:hypothetical protein
MARVDELLTWNAGKIFPISIVCKQYGGVRGG